MKTPSACLPAKALPVGELPAWKKMAGVRWIDGSGRAGSGWTRSRSGQGGTSRGSGWLRWAVNEEPSAAGLASLRATVLIRPSPGSLWKNRRLAFAVEPDACHSLRDHEAVAGKFWLQAGWYRGIGLRWLSFVPVRVFVPVRGEAPGAPVDRQSPVPVPGPVSFRCLADAGRPAGDGTAHHPGLEGQRCLRPQPGQDRGRKRMGLLRRPTDGQRRPGRASHRARVFKDVFPRFKKTMQGYSVSRRAGWDCHGLPVELAVEKELQLSGKPDIEKLGIDVFNARCRESVLRHVGEFEQLTSRMGYWIDLENAYETMSPEYVDSVWWSLKKIFDDGRLSEDFRVAPYCPRCGTALSEHEVAQGYETVTDPSVHVRLPLSLPLAGHDDVHLLVWTTTPWTLVANTAVAVHPAVTYAVAATEDGTFVVAEPLVRSVLGERAVVLALVPGADLGGLTYRRPFDLVDVPDAHRVVLANYVTTSDGTGLVHQAPAFGADDLTVCRANGLPVINPVGPNGRFLEGVPLVGGVFFKDADPILTEDLQRRGLLFRAARYEHTYPHCWRCHTPLMYYAQLSWYVRTTSVGAALQRENERTTWYPEHIKNGRFGDWLDNNIDWALSRSRYWGTPLPLWRCGGGHVTAIGSRAELVG